jgi:16S rRNA U1498 N3-methylase RsmE
VEASQVGQSEGNVPAPGWSFSRKSHVVAVIGPEGGHANAGVVVVIVGELRRVE